jgi:dephospho-CoA kinase
MTSHSIPVIGIAGGIGSGKSTVARALQRLGCVVSDSDAEARACLTRPDIKETIVAWWGAAVLDADGQVDRRAVARVVFAQPAERRRLEDLIHPILHTLRRQHLAGAIASGARAFVIDAPLLFEAGLQDECDAVIFVDASRETRLARVRSSRGWDDAELDRREAAQWPIEAKKAASDVIVSNNDAAPSNEALEGILRGLIAARPDRG